jgi:hypothetical protein
VLLLLLLLAASCCPCSRRRQPGGNQPVSALAASGSNGGCHRGSGCSLSRCSCCCVLGLLLQVTLKGSEASLGVTQALSVQVGCQLGELRAIDGKQ